jgi:uncharacterized paraquat-inducible protein A
MIVIGFAEFFTTATIVMLVYIIWLWLREHNRQKRNEWQLNNRQLFHCNTCHLSFVPKYPVSLCRCPRCNTVCIRRKSGVVSTGKSGGKK